jgi:hypothetical protein
MPRKPVLEEPKSPYGRLEIVDGRVVCHVCGRAFGHLGAHVAWTHDMSADEYRKKFGLNRGTGLIGPELTKKRQSRVDQLTPFNGSDGSAARAAGYRWRHQGKERVKSRPRGLRGRFEALRPERFWANVEKTDNCWIWTGYKNSAGYGNLSLNYGEKKAHRYAWAVTYGQIPAGMFVLHRCDNPSCVRPDHLFLGDQKANVQDMMTKGRWAGRRLGTHCPHGHEYTVDNIVVRKTGGRACRTCMQIRDRKRKQRTRFGEAL